MNTFHNTENSRDLIAPEIEIIKGVETPKLKQIPENIHSGAIILEPTIQAMHDLLSIFRYYSMSVIQDLSSVTNAGKLNEKFPVPNTINLTEIALWIKKIATYIDYQPRSSLRHASMLKSTHITKPEPLNIYFIQSGINDTENLYMESSIAMLDNYDASVMSFHWKWRNYASVNMIYKQMIQSLLLHTNCIDWRIAK